MITIIQIGLGPLGRQIGRYIDEKNEIQTVAAVDINKDLKGKDFGEFINGKASNVFIENTVDNSLKNLI